MPGSDKISQMLEEAKRAEWQDMERAQAGRELVEGRRRMLYGVGRGAPIPGVKRSRKAPGKSARRLPGSASTPSLPTGLLGSTAGGGSTIGGSTLGGGGTSAYGDGPTYDGYGFKRPAGSPHQSYEHDQFFRMGYFSTTSTSADRIFSGGVAAAQAVGVSAQREPWYMGYQNSTAHKAAGSSTASARRYGSRGATAEQLWHCPPYARPDRTVEPTTPAFLANSAAAADPFVAEWTPKLSAAPAQGSGYNPVLSSPGLWPENSQYVTGFGEKRSDTTATSAWYNRQTTVSRDLAAVKTKTAGSRRLARLLQIEHDEDASLRSSAEAEAATIVPGAPSHHSRRGKVGLPHEFPSGPVSYLGDDASVSTLSSAGHYSRAMTAGTGLRSRASTAGASARRGGGTALGRPRQSAADQSVQGGTVDLRYSGERAILIMSDLKTSNTQMLLRSHEFRYQARWNGLYKLFRQLRYETSEPPVASVMGVYARLRQKASANIQPGTVTRSQFIAVLTGDGETQTTDQPIDPKSLNMLYSTMEDGSSAVSPGKVEISTKLVGPLLLLAGLQDSAEATLRSTLSLIVSERAVSFVPPDRRAARARRRKPGAANAAAGGGGAAAAAEMHAAAAGPRAPTLQDAEDALMMAAVSGEAAEAMRACLQSAFRPTFYRYMALKSAGQRAKSPVKKGPVSPVPSHHPNSEGRSLTHMHTISAGDAAHSAMEKLKASLATPLDTSLPPAETVPAMAAVTVDDVVECARDAGGGRAMALFAAQLALCRENFTLSGARGKNKQKESQIELRKRIIAIKQRDCNRAYEIRKPSHGEMMARHSRVPEPSPLGKLSPTKRPSTSASVAGSGTRGSARTPGSSRRGPGGRGSASPTKSPAPKTLRYEDATLS